ncbi:MAG: carboxypeptidase regulatory-like domain-containing protein, partial [Armatimonadota bacterium]|nr:carboxypeptidase regulatory-like domain-containing protein [Armatimonadota bacterium]
MNRILGMVLCLLATGVSAGAAPLGGTVVGPDGKPVAGAQVIVGAGESPSDFVTRRTDAAGNFTVDLGGTKDKTQILPWVVVQAPGFGLGGIYLMPSQDVIHLDRPGRIQGRVTNAARQPVAGATIKLQNVAPSSRGSATGFPLRFPFYVIVPLPLESKFTAKSGQDGRWTLSGVPITGRATLYLQHPAYVSTYFQADLKPETVEVPPLKLRPTAVITGRVVFEDGKPAPGVKVSTRSHGDEGHSKAVSGADGAYRLTGLPTGAFNVVTGAPSAKLVAIPVENVKTREGRTVQAPPVVLTSGAIVQGRVVDQESGAPLPDVRIASSRAEAYFMGDTDKQGRYTLRVPPGPNQIYIMGMPMGYLEPEQGNAGRLIDVEVKKGETKTINFRLKKGLTIAGTAQDTEGKPATGATIRVMMRGDNDFGDFHRHTSEVDATGKWTIINLKPGKARLITEGEWQIVTPREIDVPVRGPITVTLRRVPLLHVKGRVVSPDGQPIAEATVKLMICIPTSDTSSLCPTEEVETDAAGQFSHPVERRDARVSLTVEKPGYRYVSGGHVSKTGEAFEVTDAILQPLGGVLKGRVIDTKGAPVAGAEVFVLDNGPQAAAVTAGSGQFEIKDLAPGAVRAVAAYAGSIGEARGTTGVPLDITLTPAKPPLGQDQARAVALLENLHDESKAQKAGRNPVSALARVLAPYDPERALKMIQAETGALPQSELTSLIDAMAENNPARAAEWAMPLLSRIEDPKARFDALVSIGLAAVATQPETARELYHQAREIFDAHLATDKKWSYIGQPLRLGQLAARLKSGDAANYFWKAAISAMRAPEKGQLEMVVRSIYEVDIELGEKVADQLEDFSAEDRREAYANAIVTAAKYDPAAAKRLLLKLGPGKDNRSASSYGQLARFVIEAIGRSDPSGALALARTVHDKVAKPAALAAAARFQPKSVALKLFREAADAVPPRWTVELAKIAALAYEVDAELGREIFAAVKEQIDYSLALRGG